MAIAEPAATPKMIADAGGVLMTDTCPRSRVPKGTRVAALDSAKQAHYLPAIMGSGWFGSADASTPPSRPLERGAA